MRVLRVILTTFGLLVAFLAAAGSSSGGTFALKQCKGSLHQDFQAKHMAINGSIRYDTANGCVTGGSGRFGVYQDKGGGTLAFGEGGQFRWDAPAGTSVVGAQFSARLKDANGIKAQLVGFDGTSVTDIDGGALHDGEVRRTSWSDPSRPQTMIIARAVCDAVAGCPNGSAGPKAFIESTDVELTVRDGSGPGVSASGQLWSWAGDGLHHRGATSIRIDVSDQGAGVAEAWVEVNGLRVDFSAPFCPGDKGSHATRFSPCPASFTATRGMNTAAAPFQEGANEIRLCARDYAEPSNTAHKSCTGTRIVLVDNDPSNPPLELRAEEGPGWRAENGFNLRWSVPGGQVSPVIGAVYLLKELEGETQVAQGFFPGADDPGSGYLEVPEIGAYRAVVYLVDSAGNLGESAETVLRFDDRPPGNVDPVPPTGWVSSDELPLEQEIEKAEPGGPSGIDGYALTVSVDGPEPPCGSWVCLAPEVTLTGGAEARTGSIGGLEEGAHWVSAAAVSGARRASLEPGSTVVQVDRTPPDSSISDIPNEWVNRPVSVTVQATDALSGMQAQAGDDGEPRTVIEAGDHAPYSSPGPVATFVVANEGVNRIRYWAEDLAGNANDGERGPGGERHASPGHAVVRIDTTPPSVGFQEDRDPDSPETVRLVVTDADSGVASATIGVRPAGSDEGFRPLPTTGGDGVFEARIPSDDLAKGAYELSGTATDRAGNVATGNEAMSGRPMILNVPLKRTVSLDAQIGKRTSGRSWYGGRKYLEGRLSSGGEPLGNQVVRVTQRFAAGSRSGDRVSLLTTDGDGRYRLKLPAGPSRVIQVGFDGTSKFSRAESAPVRLKVKGRVTMRLKKRKVRNGRALRIRGSVGFRGALPPESGKLVAVQYFDPTRQKWRPVEVLRTNRRGRFRYTYRFRTISSAQKIRFRATSLPEAGWPYLPSTSRPRSVIVFPKGRRGR